MRSLAAAALALGALALLWGRMAWPGHALIRGHLGDVGATMLVYALASLLTSRRLLRATLSATVALTLELAQRHHDGTPSTLSELTIGASFDPWDLLAYALGITLSLAWDSIASPAPSRHELA